MVLKGDIIKWLEKKKVGWSYDSVSKFGVTFVDTLTDCLWYIDSRHNTFESRACQIPVMFKEFQGYNKPELTKHRRREAENMCAGVLHNYSLLLNKHLMQPWFSSTVWKPLRGHVVQLADSMNKYAVYLNQKNATVQENHSLLGPVHEAESFCVVNGAQWMNPTVMARFNTLQQHAYWPC